MLQGFIVHVKLENIYGDLPEDNKIRFDTSNYEVNRPLLIGKSKKLIGPIKDELGGKIMKEIVATVPKMYSYLMHDDHVDKKGKCTKKFFCSWDSLHGRLDSHYRVWSYMKKKHKKIKAYQKSI